MSKSIQNAKVTIRRVSNANPEALFPIAKIMRIEGPNANSAKDVSALNDKENVTIARLTVRIGKCGSKKT